MAAMPIMAPPAVMMVIRAMPVSPVIIVPVPVMAPPSVVVVIRAMPVSSMIVMAMPVMPVPIVAPPVDVLNEACGVGIR
jgi:hypothetical protein